MTESLYVLMESILFSRVDRRLLSVIIMFSHQYDYICSSPHKIVFSIFFCSAELLAPHPCHNSIPLRVITPITVPFETNWNFVLEYLWINLVCGQMFIIIN